MTLMTSRWARTGALLLASLFLGACLPAGASALNTYTVTPITAPAGGSVYALSAINAGGELVGSGTPAGDSDTGTCGFAWQSGTFTWLTPGFEHQTYGGDNCAGPGSGGTEANDLNNAGLIVGDTEYLYQQDGGSPPFPSYVQATIWKTAGAPPTGTSSDCSESAVGQDNGAPGTSEAEAVNDAGAIAGDAVTPANGGCSIFPSGDWAFVGSPTDVIAPASGCLCGSSATALNDSGQAVIDDGGGQESQLYPGGQALSLNPSGMPEAINDSGAIAGVDTKNAMPAYSDGAGPAIDLTPADSIHYGQALAVNNAGDIVGMSGLNPASSTSSATIWPAAAPPATISGEPAGIDLNCLIPADAGIHLTEANAINGTGSILAEGLVGTATEWVLLTPTAAQAGDSRGAARVPYASEPPSCPLNVTVMPINGGVAGLGYKAPNATFLGGAGGITDSCFSGCRDLVVTVTDPNNANEPVPNAKVTVTITPIAAADIADGYPSGSSPGAGYICELSALRSGSNPKLVLGLDDPLARNCSASGLTNLTTDDQGQVYLRYLVTRLDQ